MLIETTVVNFFVSESLYGEASSFKEQLSIGSKEIDWVLVDNANDAEVVFCGNEDEVLRMNKYILVPDSAKDTLHEYLETKIIRGDLILPTEMGIKTFQSRLSDEQDRFSKLKRNNPKHLAPSGLPEEGTISMRLELSAFAVHPSAMERYIPAVKKVFDRRATRSLQRELPSYQPLKCNVPDQEILDLYPDLPTNGSDLNARIATVSDKLAKLGVVPALSDMTFSQLNLGIPFPGGANRDIMGLISPSETYKECAKHIAKIMLSGAARQLDILGIDEFKNENTRVGVKKSNYQGVPLSTTSHAVRQTAWAVMQRSKEGIFHFEKYRFPTGGGFRSQANGNGKLRASFCLGSTPGEVIRSTVHDGAMLKGKEIFRYDPSGRTAPTTFIDVGSIGGRKRIVENVWSAQNDATTPVPSYLAKYKDKAYKMLFQQDPDIMARFVPGTHQFHAYWTDAFNNEPWVRERAEARGCMTAESLVEKMVELKEYIIAGDVENFDGYTTWELVEPFLKHLVSDDVLRITKKLWDADKIGVYTDVNGEITYYYVNCVAESWMDEATVAEVQRTADLMSHVASGLGLTAQCGRGVVPTVMCEIAINAFSPMMSNFKDFLFKLPSSDDSYCSGINTILNSAGDDHHLSSLAIWLITGIHPKEAQGHFLKEMADYKTLIITREIPAMNAGYLFHESEDGSLIGVSLSPSRLWSNTVNPEYPRSAIGLWHSTDQYVRSAVGSVLEQTMSDLAELIVVDLYGFESLEQLHHIAMLEEAYLQEHAGDFSPAERIAALLSIPVNKLEWAIELEDLIEMGIDSDLINEYRRPIPADLTVDPTRFLNLETLLEINAVKTA